VLSIDRLKRIKIFPFTQWSGVKAEPRRWLKMWRRLAHLHQAAIVFLATPRRVGDRPKWSLKRTNVKLSMDLVVKQLLYVDHFTWWKNEFKKKKSNYIVCKSISISWLKVILFERTLGILKMSVIDGRMSTFVRFVGPLVTSTSIERDVDIQFESPPWRE